MLFPSAFSQGETTCTKKACSCHPDTQTGCLQACSHLLCFKDWCFKEKLQVRTRQRAGTYTEPAISSARHNEQLADRARFSCKVQESLTFQVSTASLIIKDLLPADKPAASCLWQFPKGTQTTNSSTHLTKKQGLFQKGITTGETHSGKILLLFPQRPKNRLKSTHLPK